jgi:guanylate kinase
LNDLIEIFEKVDIDSIQQMHEYFIHFVENANKKKEELRKRIEEQKNEILAQSEFSNVVKEDLARANQEISRLREELEG